MANACGKAFEDFFRHQRGAGRLSLENRCVAAHFLNSRLRKIGIGGFPLGDAGNARESGWVASSGNLRLV
jgi:hypothetical protein